MTLTIPDRNRAVKALLLRTYPGVGLSVKAGSGTAHHWIMIEFYRKVENPPGMLHNQVHDAIVDLIVSAGIHVHTYVGDGEYKGKCISTTMPHTGSPTGDPTRDDIADQLAGMARDGWSQATVKEGKTKSGCPLITLTFSDGQAFNFTITRVRS